MAAQAVRLAFQERRSFAFARMCDGLAGRLVHRQHVAPIGDYARHAIGFGPIRHVLQLGHLPEWRGRAVQVVLAHEHYRQFPHRSHVHCFVDCALVDGPIAKEADGDIIASPALLRQGHAARDWRVPADDPNRRGHPNTNIAHVHRAGFALAATGDFCHQLRHDVSRADAFGKRVPVWAVRAQHIVRLAQVRAYPHRHSLLTNVQVQCAGDAPLHKERIAALLEPPDG